MCDTAVGVTPRGVWFAKNSDRAANEAQLLDWRPAAEHPPRGVVRCTHITIPQVRRTHAVLLSRPYWQWGAEMAANEHGVILGNEAVFTRSAPQGQGLTGMDLVRLAVERADTAERAVEVIVELLSTHGQGGDCDHERSGSTYSSSFAIADRRRAYILETDGNAHAVEEVRGARAISNGLTIAGFAEPRSALVKTWGSRQAERRALAQRHAEHVRGLSDVLRLLRTHERWAPGRAGRASDPVPYDVVSGGMHGPCMHAGGVFGAGQTVASWAAWLSPEPGPGPGLGNEDVHLVTATAAPCTALYKPVRVTARVPRALLGAAPTDRADRSSLFWRHERLHRAVMRAHPELLPVFSDERDAVEAQWLTNLPAPEVAFAQGNALLARWSQQVDERLRQLAGRHRKRPWYIERYWRIRDQWAGLAPGVGRSLRCARPSEP